MPKFFCNMLPPFSVAFCPISVFLGSVWAASPLPPSSPHSSLSLSPSLSRIPLLVFVRSGWFRRKVHFFDGLMLGISPPPPLSLSVLLNREKFGAFVISPLWNRCNLEKMPLLDGFFAWMEAAAALVLDFVDIVSIRWGKLLETWSLAFPSFGSGSGSGSDAVLIVATED